VYDKQRSQKLYENPKINLNDLPTRNYPTILFVATFEPNYIAQWLRLSQIKKYSQKLKDTTKSALQNGMQRLSKKLDCHIAKEGVDGFNEKIKNPWQKPCQLYLLQTFVFLYFKFSFLVKT